MLATYNATFSNIVVNANGTQGFGFKKYVKYLNIESYCTYIVIKLDLFTFTRSLFVYMNQTD